MKGPFVKDDGTDIFKQDSALQWLIWLLILFYCIAVFFYISIFINNTIFEFTYVKNPSDPGTLTSDRYNLYWTVYFISVVVVCLFPVLAMLVILFRPIYGWNVCNSFVITLLIALHFFGLIVLTSAYIQCNKPFQPNNPCNDLRLCCVESIYTDPLNDCPNVTPCPDGPTLLDQTTPNGDFEWVYWFNVFFFLLEAVFLGLIFSYWTKGPYTDSVSMDSRQVDYEETIQVRGPTTIARSAVMQPRRGARLRK